VSTLKPITILTQNLIEEDSATLYAAGNNAAVTFNFPAAITADTLLVKNTNITALLVEYKADENDPFTTLPQQACAGQGDIIFNFPAAEQIKVIKITTASQGGVCFAEKIILARTLLKLTRALSALTADNFTRGGHHYLSDGSLLNWTEFVKQTPSLRLENMDKTTKDSLLALLKTNNFLTYIFYGPYDGSFCGQFALARPPAVNFERKTMLYRADLSLLER